MPPLPMFLIAPRAVTEDVTMEATTIGTLSIFSDLVFYLALQLDTNESLVMMECSALTRAVRTEKAFLHFQFDFEDFFNHLLTRNKITTTN